MQKSAAEADRENRLWESLRESSMPESLLSFHAQHPPLYQDGIAADICNTDERQVETFQPAFQIIF